MNERVREERVCEPEREGGGGGRGGRCMYSGTPLIPPPLGPFQVSCLVRCPDLRVKYCTNGSFGAVTTVLFIEVSF